MAAQVIHGESQAKLLQDCEIAEEADGGQEKRPAIWPWRTVW
jgi:hypothetical protein